MLGALLIGLQLLGLNVIAPAPSPTIAPDRAGGPADVGPGRRRAPGAAVPGRRSRSSRTGPARARPWSTSRGASPRRSSPSDPDGGFVVIYELPTNGDADRVGHEFASYLASGTGAVQYPRDTQFVLQRVGQTLVFFPWSAEANPDPRLPELAAALQGVGEPVTP